MTTGFSKDLLWKIKQTAKEDVWFKRGKLLIRREEGTRDICIFTEEDFAAYIKYRL